ncbi:cupin domain-containing protein [Thermanaerothrix sp. 4228-RoL]|uniref:Cupin domain-containing protein n=1 Tax=Thermanaerothrix solaris TaxID=3058434 RepID=A0ABU3NPN7_9CHLR|nr:cupin domain-containing protein [Thermanaerothrix sp. 4228-RoL]MDT8897771.1 cupin domain-containing protein [Thermanaerothrix sp. 4228-RoL]
MSKYFVSPEEVETQAFDWGLLKWMSAPNVTGAQKFSAGVVLLAPGKGHMTHNHPGPEEILYVISGYGRQTVADESMELRPGMMVFIPEGVNHSTLNTGWETLKLIAIYAPPGPEIALRELPDCRILPPGELP